MDIGLVRPARSTAQQPQALGLLDYGAVLWRRRLLFFAVFLALASVSGVVVLSLPATFQSQSTVLIEEDRIPKEFVRTSVGQYVDRRIQIITRRVMTSSNLMSIAERYDLYPEARANSSLSNVVDLMRRSIHTGIVNTDVVDPQTGRSGAASIAFVVSFDYENPQAAQLVTDELVSLFLEESQRQRTQLVEERSTLLRQESERYRKIIEGLEARLSSYKLAHASELPGMVDAHQRSVERLERQLVEADRDLRSLRERKVILETELAQVSRNAIGYASDGSPVLDSADRLMALRAEYVSKASQYAPTHPDVVQLRREIAALQAEVGGGSDTTEIEAQLGTLRADLLLVRQRYSPTHPTVEQLERRIASLEGDLGATRRTAGPAPTSRPDNPAYIQIQSRLRGVEVEIKHYLESRSTLQTKIEDYETKIARAPALERELNALQREHDNALARYQELATRQMDAELASSLERNNQGEHLFLIEPASLPEEPIKPNRPILLLLGVLLSFGSAVGATVLREYLDDCVRTSHDLMEILHRAPLGVIPVINVPTPGQALRRGLVFGAVASAALLSSGWYFANRAGQIGMTIPAFVGLSLDGLAAVALPGLEEKQPPLPSTVPSEEQGGL